MKFNNVVIIIPTYNEEPTIEETLRQLLHVAATINEHHVNILVFDSGSTDRTASLVKSMQLTEPRLYLQTETHKSGLGSAYLQAMRHALYSMNADVVFEFDADLSHQPHYIAPMLEHLKMHETENRNAVLIYLRLKTKEIAIIGDQGIHMHVGDSFWLAVKDEAIQTINSHTITEGIRKAVLLVGKQLSRFFPPSDENPNELPNEITSGKI
jgi:glycosyltransferase involved in cell wall biosynthesis